MENNTKLPAYPLPITMGPDGSLYDAIDYSKGNGGFTKLELASLMIAEGLTKRDFADPYSPEGVSTISKSAVNLAKAVLEEANK